MPSTFPIDLPVAGRPVLVVGGGPAALGAIAALREGGAAVTVVAADPTDSVADLADRGLLRLVSTDEVDDALLMASWLVIDATDDDRADSPLARRADELGRICVPALGAGPTGDDSGPGSRSGRVVLVGGGPGDPGLLTVAGLRAVREADVLVCDRLAPLAVLREARPQAEIVDVAKIPRGATTSQEEINRILVDRGLAGLTVVRLKGGDNFVFGRGGEEWQACVAAGLPVEVIPGVSSAIAAPAAAGIPATHRDLNQGFTVVTGHVPPGDPRSTLDWDALARTGTAIIVMMGMANLELIAIALIAAGLDPQTPAATVADGGLPSQRTVRAPLHRIAEQTSAAGLRSPAVVVIGSVAAFDPAAAS